MMLLISASQVAGITGMIHQCLALMHIFKVLFLFFITLWIFSFLSFFFFFFLEWGQGLAM
jgi:hypothetical protein